MRPKVNKKRNILAIIKMLFAFIIAMFFFISADVSLLSKSHEGMQSTSPTRIIKKNAPVSLP